MANIISIIRVDVQDAEGENKNKYWLIDHYRWEGEQKIDQYEEIKNLSKNDKIKLIKNNSLSIDYSVNKAKIEIAESELLRILKAVHPEGFIKEKEDEKYTFWFDSDIIAVDVGKSASTYRNVHSYQYVDKKGDPEIRTSKAGKQYTRYINKNKVKKHIVSNDENGCIFVNGKKYRYLFSTSGDVRGQKARYVLDEIYDKVMEVLYCGMDCHSKMLSCKRNSYLGMAASTSTPVTMPNFVVIDDYQSPVTEKYDYVKGDVSKAHYDVESKPGTEKFKVFDGHGLVDLKLAKQWAKELGLDYIPATFQFRSVPGIKGCVSTFDINTFADENDVDTIIDCGRQKHSLKKEHINLILTLSQFKFAAMMTQTQWKENIASGKYGYTYTWNISDYSVMLHPKQGSKSKALKQHEHLSYQPLQVLELTDQQIANICSKTLNKVERMHTDVDYFLKWRGVNEDSIKYDKSLPPEYKALYYNHDLADDRYIYQKITDDLKRTRREAHYLQIVNGAYQFIIPDLYALAQYAFGLDITGLIPVHTVYNRYWQEKQKQECLLVRNPAIYKETVIASVANEKLNNWEEIKNWFQYQQTGVVLSIHDSSLQKMQSADTDGDHCCCFFQQDILDSIKEHPSNTVIFHQLDEEKTAEQAALNNVDACIESDILGYSNDIGSIVNATTKIIAQITDDKTEEEKQKLWEWVCILSILDCLTIDFAKHGVKAEVPTNIALFLSGISKPWFQKYKDNDEDNENTFLKKINAELSKTEKKEKYVYTDSTMNRICEYMDNNLRAIQIESMNRNRNTEKKEFDWHTLFQDKPNDYRSQKYINEKKTLLALQKQWNGFCNDYQQYNAKHKQDNLWLQKSRLFFAEARNKLLQAQPNVLKCVDNIIAMYYSDADFKNVSSYAILWQCFPTQMINQVQGKTSRTTTYSVEKLNKISHTICSKKKKNPKLKSTMSLHILLTDNDKKVYLTSSEQRRIKSLTETSRGARLYIALLWIARKQNNNTLNVVTKYSKSNKNKSITEYDLMKLCGINRFSVPDAKAELCNCGLLAINLKGKITEFEIQEIKIDCEKKELPICSEKMKKWINHNFPKKNNEPYKYYKYNRYTCGYDKIA